METKQVSVAPDLKGAGDEGHVRAAFSVFDVVDSQGDVVVKDAFTDGQPVPMVWSHDWTRIVGKGVVRVTPSQAVFDGRFFLDTTEGLNAYRTVKAMGDLQEYSFGFSVLDAEPGVKDGADVRFLKGLEVYEASPVLVGANRRTRTLSLKGFGLPFDAHTETVLVAWTEWLERARSGSDLREKDGRPLSDARRATLGAAYARLRAGLDEVEGLLAQKSSTGSVDPPTAALVRELERFRRLQAQFGLSPQGV